jgi:hypothetical protein
MSLKEALGLLLIKNRHMLIHYTNNAVAVPRQIGFDLHNEFTTGEVPAKDK